MNPHFRRMPGIIGRSDLVARVHLLPSGDHQLEVAIDGTPIDLLLSRDQVSQLHTIIAEFNRRVTFEDGGPERLHKRVEALT